MPYRKVRIVKDEMYHICSKSIADFKIFNCEDDYERIKDEFLFYSAGKPVCSFYSFRELNKISELRLRSENESNKIVNIVAYCIMPTHIHLILKEKQENGISAFMGAVLKSYSRYFNNKHKRKGPLWESRFTNVLIKNDEQFVHVTRYVHLNPVTAYLVNNPVNWKHSSFREYVNLIKEEDRICRFSEYLDMDAFAYRKFVNDQIDYQRSLALIKKLTIS